MLLPLIISLEDFGKFTYYLAIYYFFLSTWESTILDPWVLLKNKITNSRRSKHETPPFVAYSLVLSAVFVGVLSFFHSVSWQEASLLVALSALSLWRVFSRRIRYQNNEYVFLFSISMISIVTRIGLMLIFWKHLNYHTALLIFFASDIPAIVLDIPFIKMAIKNVKEHTSHHYFVENRSLITNLFYQQITTWLYPFTISTLTVGLLSFQLNGLLKMIINLTMPLKLLNRNLMHQFLKTYEGDPSNYRSGFAHYINLAKPYTFVSLAIVLLFGPIYLLQSAHLSTQTVVLMLIFASMNIVFYTITNGLKASFSKALNLKELSKLNTYVFPAGISLFFIMYGLQLEYAPIIAEMITPFIETIFFATVFKKYFKGPEALTNQT